MYTNPLLPPPHPAESPSGSRSTWAVVFGVVALSAPWIAILAYGTATPSGSDAGIGGVVVVGLGGSLAGCVGAIVAGAGVWDGKRRRPPAGLVLGLLAGGGWTFPLAVAYLPAAVVLAAVAARGSGRTTVARASTVLALLAAGAAPWWLLIASGALAQGGT